MREGTAFCCSWWSNISDSITDNWRPEAAKRCSSTCKSALTSLTGMSLVGPPASPSPRPGVSLKSNSPSSSLPIWVSRSPSALRRVAWACSSPRRAASALTWVCASRLTLASSASWRSTLACSRESFSALAPMPPARPIMQPTPSTLPSRARGRSSK
ncbi:hypothetical protein G6F68_015628 [Rhizopus microsporus]|nr:hypothetical protein G6F68_015628 [Rhizopus microsporus]